MTSAEYTFHPKCYYLTMNSDMMEPTIPEGYVMIFDPYMKSAGDDVVMAKVLDEDAEWAKWWVCRTIELENEVVLMFDNPNYEGMVVPKDRYLCEGLMVGLEVRNNGEQRTDAEVMVNGSDAS